jgi:uncharacterized protein YndB with AHSA1/START domain
MDTTTRIDRGSTATTRIWYEGGDLSFERTFDAPRALVWRAFTDAELIPLWWGRHGSTTRVEALDVRPGGRWRFVSSAPDREDVAFFGEFLSVDPPREYRWTFMFDVGAGEPQGGPETYTFVEVDGRTTVTAVGHMGTPEVLEAALATGMVEGAIETWDRLEALLPTL